MSDIYLSLTETPAVVTLSQPVVSGVLSSNVTVTNVVSVNVVTMPAITVQAAAPAVTTVAGSVAVTTMPALSISSVSISNFPATQTIAGTVTANNATLDSAVYFVSGQDVNTIRTVIYSGGDLGGDQGAPVDGLNPLPVSLSSLPAISGTVTVGAMPNGALTTRFGTPVTANQSFATSAVTNANRKYLLIQNVTTQSNVITVGIGFTPTTTQGIQLTAGAGITFESSYIPTGAVYVLSSVTASNFTILEA